MADKFDRVRKTLGNAEDVDLPDGLADEGASPDADAPGWDGIDPGPRDDGREGDEPPIAARCVQFPLNDYGNGLRLVEHFGPDLIWVSRVGWFCWTGQVWRADPDGIDVRRLAYRLTDLIAQEIWHLPIDDEDAEVMRQVADAEAEYFDLNKRRKDLTADEEDRLHMISQLRRRADDIKDRRDKSVGRRLTHAKNAGNSNALKNLMGEGGTIIARPLEDLDAAALDINTETCVLRFSHDPSEDDQWNPSPHPSSKMDCLPHAREQLLTKIMPVAYDPDAKCPLFAAFLDRIQPVPEMRRFLQRWFGLSMTGIKVQNFAFLFGSGANGKSVLVDVMARLMGDYAASAKIESLTGTNRRGGGDATPDLVPLIGARFVRTSEPSAGDRLQEGLIKQLTGGEPMLIRALQENFVLIYPIFKLTMSGNHKPEIHGGDDGIWRRVLLVPFDVQIPAEERDKDLIEKLWEERSGILNWLIEGLMDYLEHGLQIPAGVAAATDEYREESDPVGAFLTSCCGVSGKPEHSIRAKDLSDAFAFWMEESGRGAWKAGTIFKKLKAKAGKWRHPNTGQMFQARKSSESFYDGIDFIDPFRTQFLAWQSRRDNATRQGKFDE